MAPFGTSVTHLFVLLLNIECQLLATFSQRLSTHLSNVELVL